VKHLANACLIASIFVIGIAALIAHKQDQYAIAQANSEIRNLQRRVALLSRDKGGNAAYDNESQPEPPEECISWIN